MSRMSIPVILGKGRDFQEFGHCPLSVLFFLGLVTVIAPMGGLFIIG